MANYVESIFYYYNKKIEHYGLQILFKFYSNNYLLFDSSNFILLNDIKIFDKLFRWKKIDYPELSTKNVQIKNIMEDELTCYFIEFSNNDIFYIYQRIDEIEHWEQDFKIASKNKNLIEYNEIKKYMNEDWIDKINIKDCD